MNRKSKKYSQKTVGILSESFRVIVSVWVCGSVRVFVWVIVAYYCVYVWVAYCVSEGTNAAHCFNRI